MRKIKSILVLISVMAGFVVAVSAAPPAGAVTTHTLAQTEAKMRTITVGPNSHTAWGAANFTGTWTNYLDCNNRRHYVPGLRFTNHNPTRVTGARVTDAPSPEVICQPGSPNTRTVIADGSWWNPGSWDWAAIWGSIWNTIRDCINGVTHTALATLGANAAAAGLVEGATIELTPGGAVVLAVGACIAGISW